MSFILSLAITVFYIRLLLSPASLLTSQFLFTFAHCISVVRRCSVEGQDDDRLVKSRGCEWKPSRIIWCRVRPFAGTAEENDRNSTQDNNKKTTTRNSVAFSSQANYTDWATAICWRNLVPTSSDRGVSRGQSGGSTTVVNLSFLDRNR
jgi:hypothetical protein